MSFEDIREFDFCQNICIHHNRYDGWCNYYYVDICEIEECEYCKDHIE